MNLPFLLVFLCCFFESPAFAFCLCWFCSLVSLVFFFLLLLLSHRYQFLLSFLHSINTLSSLLVVDFLAKPPCTNATQQRRYRNSACCQRVPLVLNSPGWRSLSPPACRRGRTCVFTDALLETSCQPGDPSKRQSSPRFVL